MGARTWIRISGCSKAERLVVQLRLGSREAVQTSGIKDSGLGLVAIEGGEGVGIRVGLLCVQCAGP